MEGGNPDDHHFPWGTRVRVHRATRVAMVCTLKAKYAFCIINEMKVKDRKCSLEWKWRFGGIHGFVCNLDRNYKRRKLIIFRKFLRDLSFSLIYNGFADLV